MPRILGVDYGQRRIGFALSDPDAIVASAREVVEVRGEAQALAAIEQACRTWGVERIVLGLPINMDGSRGPAAQLVERVAGLLRAQVHLPVDLWDERLTTRAAHGVLMEAGTRREKRKGLVDKVAAQMLLQCYLDARSQPGRPVS